MADAEADFIGYIQAQADRDAFQAQIEAHEVRTDLSYGMTYREASLS